MDADLKAYLERFSSDFASLKTDLAGMKTDMASLKTDMAVLPLSLMAQVETRIAELKSELKEHTEAVETRLLTEFWKWARTTEARYRQSQGSVGVMEERLQYLEDRVAALESQRPPRPH